MLSSDYLIFTIKTNIFIDIFMKKEERERKRKKIYINNKMKVY